MEIILGIFIPFIGTIIGTSIVFFMKNTLNKPLEKMLLGLASGVMIAASIWSLLMPSFEMAKKQGVLEWWPATIGFICGIVFLIVTDIFITKLENKLNLNQNNESYRNNLMLFLAVTLHNIPEGMAVGVCFASVLSGNVGVSLLSAIILALGIAIQNIPEGAIISMPMKLDGVSKKKSFFTGVMSGVVEPIASLITIVLINVVVPLLPYLLAFAAGAMIYVVFEELVPEMHNGNKSFWGIISVMIGFIVMMVLDITLG